MLHPLIIIAIYCLWCPISQEFRMLTKAYRCTHLNTFASTHTHMHSLSHTHTRTHAHKHPHVHNCMSVCTTTTTTTTPHLYPPPPHTLKLHIQMLQESAVQAEHTHIFLLPYVWYPWRSDWMFFTTVFTNPVPEAVASSFILALMKYHSSVAVFSTLRRAVSRSKFSVCLPREDARFWLRLNPLPESRNTSCNTVFHAGHNASFSTHCLKAVFNKP